MIGLNPLRKKVLITTDEVIFHGPTESKVDPRILVQSIIVAETRFIKPFIGSVPYDAMVAAKNNLVTDENKEDLQAALNEGRSGKEIIILNKGDYVNSDSYLNSVQLALWQNHLHKIVAECVVYTAMPGNRARFANQGMLKNSPDVIGGSSNTASIGMGELKTLMDQTMFTRIGPLMDDMHAYLCKNAYPGYTIKNTGTRRSGISLDMYDDEDEKCNCKW
jgi:hypothetical protein